MTIGELIRQLQDILAFNPHVSKDVVVQVYESRRDLCHEIDCVELQKNFTTGRTTVIIVPTKDM